MIGQRVTLLLVLALLGQVVWGQTIQGIVLAESGEPLGMAHCQLGDQWTSSDESGRFQLMVPEGVSELVVSFLGFETQTVNIEGQHFLRVVMPASQENLGAASVIGTRELHHGATRASVQSLSAQELDQVPGQSRIQALQSIAGVQMMSAGVGMLRPVIRGLSGLRVATLFMGSRVESQAWGEGHGIFFPEQGVSRMEVIRGPEVLQYGPDAFGGVLNVIPDGPLPEEGRLTRASLTMQSTNLGTQASVLTQKRSAKTHHVLLTGFNQMGDYRLPDGTQVDHSGLRQFYSQGRFGYLREWGTWEGAYSSCYNTAGIIGAGGTQQSGDHMLTSSAHFRVGAWEWTPRWSYQLNHRKEFDFIDPIDLGEPDADEFIELDLSLRTTRLEVQGHRKGSLGWEWTTGLQSFVQSNQNDTALIDVDRAFIPDASMQGLGGFVRASKGFLEDQLVATATARTDVQATEWSARPLLEGAAEAMTQGGERTFLLPSAALGLLWNPSDRQTVALHAMQGNRAPGLSELLAFGVHHDSFREERGDPDLNAERSRSIEMQWVRSKPDESGCSWEVSSYVNRIDGFMALTSLEEVGASGLPVQLHQAQRATLRGADVEFDWVIPAFPAWSTHCALSAIQATDDQGDVLAWIPPNNGRWELTRKGQAMESLAMQSSVIVEASRDAVLVHAGMSWTSEGASRRWVTNLQVMNLTNQTYIPTLSLLRNVGVPEPGRNVRLQLVFEW